MEPLIHFILPFTALTLLDVEFQKALPISFLAVLPDLDILFLVHRSLSHSLTATLSVTVPSLFLVYKFKPSLRRYALLASMSVASHLALDLFTGYTPILWPFLGCSVWIQVGLLAHVGSPPSLTPTGQLLTKPIAFKPFEGLDAPVLTGEGLILTTLLITPILFKTLRMRLRL